MYFCYKVRLVRNMEAKRIERIRLMESALNRWIELGNEGEKLLFAMQEAIPQLEDLITYYSSTDWFIDKESSDRNEFPEDRRCLRCTDPAARTATDDPRDRGSHARGTTKGYFTSHSRLTKPHKQTLHTIQTTHNELWSTS